MKVKDLPESDEEENYSNGKKLKKVKNTILVNYENVSQQSNLQKRNCTCSKTQCLKKYCECFSSGKFCVDCGCENCLNIPENSDNVNEMRAKLQVSQSLNNEDEYLKTENIVCNCTKSGCMKKYCECFKAGKQCSKECRCINCDNVAKISKTNQPYQKSVKAPKDSHKKATSNSSLFTGNKANYRQLEARNKEDKTNTIISDSYASESEQKSQNSLLKPNKFDQEKFTMYNISLLIKGEEILIEEKFDMLNLFYKNIQNLNLFNDSYHVDDNKNQNSRNVKELGSLSKNSYLKDSYINKKHKISNKQANLDINKNNIYINNNNNDQAALDENKCRRSNRLKSIETIKNNDKKNLKELLSDSEQSTLSPQKTGNFLLNNNNKLVNNPFDNNRKKLDDNPFNLSMYKNSMNANFKATQKLYSSVLDKTIIKQTQGKISLNSQKSGGKNNSLNKAIGINDNNKNNNDNTTKTALDLNKNSKGRFFRKVLESEEKLSSPEKNSTYSSKKRKSVKKNYDSNKKNSTDLNNKLEKIEAFMETPKLCEKKRNRFYASAKSNIPNEDFYIKSNSTMYQTPIINSECNTKKKRIEVDKKIVKNLQSNYY